MRRGDWGGEARGGAARGGDKVNEAKCERVKGIQGV